MNLGNKAENGVQEPSVLRSQEIKSREHKPDGTAKQSKIRLNPMDQMHLVPVQEFIQRKQGVS